MTRSGPMEEPTAVAFGRALLPAAAEGSAPYWRLSLRAISQLAFQTNEITAAVFVVAVASYGWVTGLWQQVPLLLIGALAGTAGARATAAALGTASSPPMQIGLYGFNSCLVGLALGNFFEVGAALWIWAVLLATAVGALTAAADRFVPFPVLAWPFIIPFWVVYAIQVHLGLALIPLPPWDTGGDVFYLQAAIAATGSSLFAGVLLAGILYLVGVTLSNWRHALVALADGRFTNADANGYFEFMLQSGAVIYQASAGGYRPALLARAAWRERAHGICCPGRLFRWSFIARFRRSATVSAEERAGT